MKVGIITPAPPRSRYGNRVTALRWTRILRRLGHRVAIAQVYEGEAYDLLIGLHARRSYRAIRCFHRDRPNKPLVVALTGTDLYHDLPKSRQAQKSLELASRIVVLQPKALEELEPHLRRKARVIYQSVSLLRRTADSHQTGLRAGRGSVDSQKNRTFDICVIGHLRPVKDPFRAALAARLLPASSRIRVLQVGGAMTQEMTARARLEMEVNPRYRWLGEQPRWRVQRILARSRLCVLSSKLEGGANILSEAIVARVPVLASRIPGSVGILGEDYPGYFESGDTRGLTQLLRRAETDGIFLVGLKARCRKVAPIFNPRREEKAWAHLLDELAEKSDTGNF